MASAPADAQDEHAVEKLAVEICDALTKHLDSGQPAPTFRPADLMAEITPTRKRS